MERFKIKIFPHAQKDLREIIDYINTLSTQAAIKYYDLLVERIGSIADMPERCPLAKDTQLRLRGYRTLHVKNYIVFYVVKADVVEIRRILYARRQYEDLL
ncbi:MAG: addiction module toxin, RelE/StbE family [Eubacterium sp.]|jgi:addiction module RelE/StbE family toxin|nr:addiction module toxin, RelE/StbE family [Eubacterium sp.]